MTGGTVSRGDVLATGASHCSAAVPAPFGTVVLWAAVDGLVSVEISLDRVNPAPEPSSAVLREAVSQLHAYLADGRFRFSLPLSAHGTSLQQRVWLSLSDIAAGTTKTYGELARSLGTGARAVAGACRANAFPLLVPCHRVVAATGVGGYCGSAAGPWIDVKRWLLRHEAG